jgi:hypothetical protein
MHALRRVAADICDRHAGLHFCAARCTTRTSREEPWSLSITERQVKDEKFREAVLILAGRRSLSKEGSTAVSGLHIDPTVDGAGLILHCDGHTIECGLPDGVSFEQAVLNCRWISPVAPKTKPNQLTNMATVGSA